MRDLAKLMLGAPVAELLGEKTKKLAIKLREDGVAPTLAIVRVGETPGGMAYERAACKKCGDVHVSTRCVTLPANVPDYVVTGALANLSADDAVHGILLLRPLARSMNERAICAAIAPGKDVDGASAASMAALYSGGVGFAPCTAVACMELLRHYGVELMGKRAVVVGRSLVVGRPLAMMLLAESATVTICHSRTPDVAPIVREADIVIAAAGRIGLIGADCLRPGQTVIDVSVNMGPEGKMLGDVDFEAADAVDAVAPVPGGVGPVTNAVLAWHTVTAARNMQQ